MNESEWMNVFHSVMQPFSHSMITNYLVLALPGYGLRKKYKAVMNFNWRK